MGKYRLGVDQARVEKYFEGSPRWQALFRDYLLTIIGVVDRLTEELRLPSLPHLFHSCLGIRHDLGSIRFDDWLQQRRRLEGWEKPLVEELKKAHDLWHTAHGTDTEHPSCFDIIGYDPQSMVHWITIERLGVADS